MAHHKSTKKRIITNEKRRLRNRSRKSEIKTWIKKFHNAQNVDEKKEILRKTQSLIDKGVKVHLFKKNKGSRMKSQLMRSLKEI